MPNDVPELPTTALDYIKRKELKPAFSYKDVWTEEHNNAFTVAKAMQVDVLADIKQAVERAARDGIPFSKFKKELAPLLEQKGWWGRKKMIDPLTGSNRRLKTIYATNLRTAHSQGQFRRGMDSPLHTHIIYRIGPSTNHREQHVTWDGLVLPKDDPFWNTHLPPNGWGCKCYFSFLTKERLEQYRKDGVPDMASVEPGVGRPTKRKAIYEKRPEIRYKTWVNQRRGEVVRVPEEVDPAFAWNPGRMGADLPLFEGYIRKTRELLPARWEDLVGAIMRNTVHMKHWESFTRRALAGRISGENTAAVGFLTGTVRTFIGKKGIKAADSAVGVEARLISGPKSQTA